MSIFSKAKADTELDAISTANQIERARLHQDREFWSDCIYYLIDEGMSISGAEQAVKVADWLLESRRERFPL